MVDSVIPVSRIAGLLALAAIGLATGCGGEPVHEVSGTITLNGQPLEQGQILFADAAGAADTAHSEIIAGRYAVVTAAGQKQVRITAPTATGRTREEGMGVMVAETIEQIPARYNTQTELVVEIAAGDSNVHDFALVAP